MAGRRLAVDWPKCKGHAVCAELLPEIVQIDEWGYPIVAPGAVPDALRKHAKRAVTSCPTLALRLVDAPDDDPAQPVVAPPAFPTDDVPVEPRTGQRRGARLTAADGPRRRARRSS